MKGAKKTIRSQIMHGYIVTIAITVFLVLVSTVCLFAIRQSYLQLTRTRSNQISTQEAVTAHYKWLDGLNASLQTGVEFTGSLDYNTCALGKWMSGVEDVDLSDDAIRSSLANAQSPHQTIHSTAQSLLDLSARDHEAAYLKYTQEIKPLTDQVIADLSTITAQYKVQSDAAAARLQTMLLISLVAGVVLAMLAAFFALTYAKSIAKKISRPVTAVADWSDELSRGVETLDTQALDMEGHCVEILRMISSFERMAANIRKNVNVVQRVADGDMTAYVHIRSAEDSLGKHLYRMVQNNDLLFAEILQVAESVAEGAKEISSASQNLANSVNTQAMSVSDLSQTVSQANALVVQTLGRTQEATRISDHVQATAAESREKMSLLVESVDATRDASKRISAVIKSIEDIAFQTNILALNAAVEAARAGAAGKGFAVVAGEVRILALKSAEAAEQTKALIENSIRKTEEGSLHSQHAAQTLEMMLSEIGKIDALIQDIYTASQQQSLGIKQVHQEIDKISSASTSNAAISEESAAASQMMHSNAETLRGYMTKFNLRQRKEGQAYIPPEKRNDPAFIHAANERYRQAQLTGTHLGIISDTEDREGVLKY